MTVSEPANEITESIDLLVIGDINPDLLLSGVEKRSSSTTMERLAEQGAMVLGGSGAITATQASKLGLATSIVSVVGNDSVADWCLGELTASGVDVSMVSKDLGVPTGITAVIEVEGERSMVTYPGAIAKLTSAMVPNESLALTRHVHASSYFLHTGLGTSVAGILDMAKESGATTSLDPNSDPQGKWDSHLASVLASVDFFFANDVEAGYISGNRDPVEAAKALATSCKVAVVKMGPEGALAVSGEEVFWSTNPDGSTPFNGIKDTTGAGDSFDAGFLAGWPIQSCLALGCFCGTKSTGALGGTAAQPTVEECMEVLSKSGHPIQAV